MCYGVVEINANRKVFMMSVVTINEYDISKYVSTINEVFHRYMIVRAINVCEESLKTTVALECGEFHCLAYIASYPDLPSAEWCVDYYALNLVSKFTYHIIDTKNNVVVA
jgi:hypothetical protein